MEGRGMYRGMDGRPIYHMEFGRNHELLSANISASLGLFDAFLSDTVS